MTHPFDEFSKSLANESVPRRESLRRMGAAVVGALFASLTLGVQTASANPDNRQPRNRRRRARTAAAKKANSKNSCNAFCNRCATKAQRKQCLDACQMCGNDPRRLNGGCGNYVCCGAGQTFCGGRCVDLNNDSNNCGTCGNICGGGTACVNGTCTGGGNECPDGQTRCGDVCVNLSTDDSNCGACGNVCQNGATCSNGICSGGGEDCPSGTARCNGVCINILSDNGNCGACGNVCPSGYVCSSGACVDPMCQFVEC
jgi:hypothetical protein